MTINEKFQELEKKAILVYLIVAFVPAWILFVLPVLLKSADSTNGNLIALIGWSLAMWMPGLGAILSIKLTEKKSLKELGLNKLGQIKIYLWAWLVPILLTLATGLITWLMGWGKLDLSLQIIKDAIEGMPEVPGLSISALMAIQIAASLTLAPLFNTLFALGEELGWRGYLLQKLLPLGQFPAIMISGVIWGVWHVPAILQGHNYPDHPVLGTGMMVVFTLLLGTFLSWLYLKTQSPWAPALAHGTVNAVAGIPLLFLSGVDITLGGTLPSIAGWLALSVLAGILIWKKEIPVEI
ncbi:MAG: CPBP family intramembrane metalloprotease [Anaerolineales bacterium]|nr:MAG: CPBP family intramembrane metalloprotease [Anaerolineales bacterium]